MVVILNKGKLVSFYEKGLNETEREIKSSYSEEYDILLLETCVLNLVNEHGNVIMEIPVLKNPNDRKFLFVKTALKNRCIKIKKDWEDYYGVVEYFADLNYAYVVNSHVVQGDTYDNIFVNFRDILTVKPITKKEKLQSLYTAVTRARKHATILV